MDAGMHAEKQSSVGRTILGIFVTILAVAALTVALRVFVFVPYEIPSGSMEETIMPGDMVFSEKISYYLRDVQAGDIVTFSDPEVAGRTLIKRVIAVGGQEVDLHGGFVYVDGERLEEPYTNGKLSYPLTRQARNANVDYPYTVPEGYVWVMGDNRTSSQDSRYFGAVPVSSITGRGAIIYWPFDHFGVLE